MPKLLKHIYTITNSIFKVSLFGIACLLIGISCNQKQDPAYNDFLIDGHDSVWWYNKVDSVSKLYATTGDFSPFLNAAELFNSVALARKYPDIIVFVYGNALLEEQGFYYKTDSLKTSIRLLRELDSLAVKSGNEKLKIWSDYFKARFFNDNLVNDIALPKLMAVYPKFKAINDELGQIVVTKRIGIIYMESYHDYRKAIDILLQALSLTKDSSEVDVISFYLTKCYLKINRIDSASCHIKNVSGKAHFLKLQPEYLTYIYAYTDSGSKTNVQNAINDLVDFSNLKMNDGILADIISSNANFSLALMKHKEFDQALKAINSGLHYDSLCNTCFAEKVNLYDARYRYFEQLKDFRNAIHYLSEYDSAVQQYNFEKSKSNVETARVNFEYERKTQEMALLLNESKLQEMELQKQNTTRNAFLSGFTLVAILTGVSYNRYRLKHKANAEIKKVLNHLKNTQEQIVENEKLAALGKITVDVARQIEVPVNTITHLSIVNKTLLNTIKIKNNISTSNAIGELKDNLNKVYLSGKEADRIVKSVLIESRKLQE